MKYIAIIILTIAFTSCTSPLAYVQEPITQQPPKRYYDDTRFDGKWYGSDSYGSEFMVFDGTHEVYWEKFYAFPGKTPYTLRSTRTLVLTSSTISLTSDWYIISEWYGTCKNASYTFNADGSLTIGTRTYKLTPY